MYLTTKISVESYKLTKTESHQANTDLSSSRTELTTEPILNS